jgi:hypothetical protein
MLLIFVPIPQFISFLLLIASNSFVAETSFVVPRTGHCSVALSLLYWAAGGELQNCGAAGYT